jgi:hypothetical protein
MSTFPNANAISNAATVAVLKTLHEDTVARAKQLFGGSAVSTLTISGGSITPTGAIHLVDAEGGAGPDDLSNANISNLPNGSILILSCVSASRPIRVMHSAGGSGQFLLNTANTMQLGDPSHIIVFQLRNTSFQELFRQPAMDAAPILTKTANYALALADRDRLVVGVSGTWTLTLPSSATAGVGFPIHFENRGAGIITIDPDSSDLVDEQSTIKIQQGETYSGINDGAGRWITKSRRRERPPSGYLFGMTLQNDTSDATNDLRITAGECASDDANMEDRVLLKTTAMYIKQLDASWAAGSGVNGGRISGSIADGTWHVFAFRDGTDGSTQIGFDQSLTPTLPNSGTHKRRIGSFLREGGAIVAFIQHGDRFTRATPLLDVNATNPTTSAVLRTMSVPNGLNLIVHGLAQLDPHDTNNTTAYFSDPDCADVAAADSVAPLGQLYRENGSAKVHGPFMVRCNTSRQIRTRLNQSDANTVLKMVTTAWDDLRGRVA